ncbi:Thiol-disulfide interchange protein, contains DsbC and DsbD domains [Litoreibacter janthinus]|uniref:Thiol-disulfide interchange protein, contains DsbC and DsbD domains n=2 Tax=Litoreibacter janthinus TaxID=670154 RepID=A0A1I6G5S3_9RHOB|nr:Thiol-disulfide interchange protein, contains DsbC and DsbD domains [Litoreibacter janthinus]
MNNTPVKSWLAACALLLATPLPVAAQIVETGASDVVKVTLLPGWRDSSGTHFAALKFVLAPGWKTYWRAPGDGGVPTRLDLSKSANLHGVKVLWPKPEVFHENGLRSIGYRDQLVLPFAFATATDGTVKIDGSLDFGVCEEICLPVHLDLSFLLPPKQVANVEEISTAMRQRPVPAQRAQVQRVKCDVTYYEAGAHIDVEIDMPPLKGRNEALVIEASGSDLWVSEPTVVRTGNTLRATAQISTRDKTPFRLNMDQVRMTVITTLAAVDIKGCS